VASSRAGISAVASRSLRVSVSGDLADVDEGAAQPEFERHHLQFGGSQLDARSGVVQGDRWVRLSRTDAELPTTTRGIVAERPTQASVVIQA